MMTWLPKLSVINGWTVWNSWVTYMYAQGNTYVQVCELKYLLQTTAFLKQRLLEHKLLTDSCVHEQGLHIRL
jgi:hypothetical protein